MPASERMAREALAADPELGGAYAVLSLALYGQGRAKQALQEAERALALDPTAEAFRAQALALHGIGRRKAALAAAREAERLAPTSPASANILGIVLEKMGKAAPAREAFARAMKLAPGNDSFRAQYGLLLLRQRRLPEAEIVAAELDPATDHIPALLLRGGVALRRNRPKEAGEFALWALSQNAVHPGALTLLVQAKAGQSRWMGAWWRMTMFFATKPPWLRAVVVVPPIVVLYFVAGPVAMVPIFYLSFASRMFKRMLRRELRAATEAIRLKKGF
jgi:tetratricopeptide (TPR) repeat protein